MLTRIELFMCKYCLDSVRHCGDYGMFYIHKTERTIHMIVGDNDKVDIGDLLNKLPPNISVEIESKISLKDPENWVLISRGIEEAEGFAYDQEDNLVGVTVEVNPKLLTVEEYYEYYRFFKKLKV